MDMDNSLNIKSLFALSKTYCIVGFELGVVFVFPTALCKYCYKANSKVSVSVSIP